MAGCPRTLGRSLLPKEEQLEEENGLKKKWPRLGYTGVNMC